MSSALRTISQIESHVKFLRRIAAYDFLTPSDMTAYLSDKEVIESLNGINTLVKTDSMPRPSTGSTTYSLVRDLGRRVTIANSSCAHRQVWIQVQAVNGSGSEGVEDSPSEYGTFWIRTFIDDGSSTIQWARLG